MTSLTFNNRSWHYTIAKFGGFSVWEDQDLCTYTRKFMLGLLKGTLISVLTGIFIAVFGYVFFSILFGVGFSIYYAAWIFTDVAISGIILILVLCLGIVVFSTICFFDNCKLKNDGFIKHAYDGWKNKFCVKIDITD